MCQKNCQSTRMMPAGVASVRAMVGKCRLWGDREERKFSELTVAHNFNLNFHKSGYFKWQFTMEGEVRLTKKGDLPPLNRPL